MEQIALDQTALLRRTLPGVTGMPLDLASHRFTKRMWAGAWVVLDRLGPGRLKVAVDWGSDTARAWAALAIGLIPEMTFRSRLDLVKQFAADHHFAVREWAWISLRQHIAEDIHAAIDALEPWAYDEDERLRRFASEATRPRGVWCIHLPPLKKDPGLGLPLLEPLRNDLARYVQLSVGNWLNDASKTKPAWVRATCDRWLAEDSSPSTNLICRRGLRSVRHEEDGSSVPDRR
jgi:3-methyladenine DNA glycosylase AlkC